MNITINKVKIIVTIPPENVNFIREELCKLEAGKIGNYTHCTTTTKCIGTFKPNNNANPYIGEKNNLEYVEEEKLEIICNINQVKKVISKLRKIHPYEEPEIDIVPLLDESLFN